MTEATTNQEKFDRRNAELAQVFTQIFDSEKQRREENNHAEEFTIFSVISATGKYIPADENDYGNSLLSKFALYFWSCYSPNSYAAAYRLGWKDALENHKNDNIRRAANGRRLIGKASRAKVKQTAEEYRHLSKDRVASEIAKRVSLEPGTVRRYLSEIFPGKDWSKKL